MVLEFFPSSANTNRQPRYKSTAYASVRVYDADTGDPLTGATGTLTMWFEGTKVIDQRAMPAATATLGAGWLRCLIADTELDTHGLYQWEIRVVSADTTQVYTEEGSFAI